MWITLAGVRKIPYLCIVVLGLRYSTSFPYRVERRGFFVLSGFLSVGYIITHRARRKRRRRKISRKLVDFSIQHEVNDAAVGCIDFSCVAFDVDGSRGVSWRVSESLRDCIVGNVEQGGNGRPRMACVIGRDAVGQIMIHFVGEFPIRCAVFSPREQQRRATIAVDDFSGFGLDLYGVKFMCFASVVGDAPVVIVVRAQRAEVSDIDADEQEREAECVEISSLPIGSVGGENGAEFVGCQCTFRGFDWRDAESTERVCSRDFVVDCIVKDGADIPQVYISGVDRRRGGGAPAEEAVEPRFRDFFERARMGVSVVSFDLHPRCAIDFACARVFVRVGEACIPVAESRLSIIVG